MADLTTLAGIEAELADTADYDVTLDISKAKRRMAALRRKLDFPQSTGRGEQNIAFAMQAIGPRKRDRTGPIFGSRPRSCFLAHRRSELD